MDYQPVLLTLAQISVERRKQSIIKDWDTSAEGSFSPPLAHVFLYHQGELAESFDLSEFTEPLFISLLLGVCSALADLYASNRVFNTFPRVRV